MQFQLDLKGKEDIYLTRFPQVNFLKNEWKAYNPIASNVEALPFSDFNWGSKISVEIPPTKGDYICKLNLNFVLPKLPINSGTFCCYTNTIGYNMFEKIEMYIGETMILSKTSESLEADFYQFNLKNDMDNMNSSIGRFDDIFKLKTNATTDQRYIVPLSLWFTKDISKAFPLFLINSQIIRIDIYTRKFENVVNYDGNLPNTVYPKEFFLDTKFTTICNSSKQIINSSQKNQEIVFPIEQDETFINNISDRNTTQFNGASRGLFIFYRDVLSEQNNDFFNYSNNTNIQNILDSIKIVVDGIEILKFTNERTIRLINSYEYYGTPNLRYIYYIPFSEDINLLSGHLNFSVIENQDIYTRINGAVTGKVFIINKRINFLKIFHNTASLIFPN